MKIEERELNIFETVIVAMEEANTRGKRIDKIILNPVEYDEFYQLAMTYLPAMETSNFLNRKTMFGMSIVVEETPIKRSKKTDA